MDTFNPLLSADLEPPLTRAEQNALRDAWLRDLAELPLPPGAPISRALWLMFICRWGIQTRTVIPVDDSLDRPDPAQIVAVVRADSLETFFQETPPALVVEVASPRTRLYDRNRKKDVYQGFGIPAYWIVEPDRDRPELTVFELRAGAYQQTAHIIGDEEYHAALPFPVTITPASLVTLG